MQNKLHILFYAMIRTTLDDILLTRLAEPTKPPLSLLILFSKAEEVTKEAAPPLN